MIKYFLLFFFSIMTISMSIGQDQARILSDQFNVIDLKEKEIAVENYFESAKMEMQLSPETVMELVKSSEGHNGFVHNKYQQKYKGIPVFGGIYGLHHMEGLVQTGTGYYIPDLNIDVNPNISAKAALAAAKRKMGAEKYSWEVEMHAHSHSGNAHKMPEAVLVILDQDFPRVSGHQNLVYQVDLTSAEPFDAVRYFVDAKMGEIVFELPLLMDHAVPSKGKSKYYGEVDFVADSIAPDEFYLRDLTRGDGIITVRPNNQNFKSDKNYWDLANENQDEVAIDAHFCATSFYDLMKNDFNWDGVDGQGKALISKVHLGRVINAFWSPTAETASFGGGDCNNGPLTTLEVVGHEFMHGVTQFSAGLVYVEESGAINESMSDVFGKALEYYVDPAGFDWWVGESFKLNDYTRPFRSFEDPNIFGHPKFYQGMNWRDGGGVHTNSSIGNHWFYNLVTGQSGTNELGDAFDIDALSIEKVLQVVFLTLTSYMGPTSDYNFYYEASLLAAQELFGPNSQEELSIKEAWKSVGLPNYSFKMILYFEAGDRIYPCLSEEFYSFNLIVYNPSSIAYLPSMGGRLIIEGKQYATLDDAILPGGSQKFTVDDVVYFEGFGANTINADLRINDPLVYSHDYQYVQNSDAAENNMALSVDRTFGSSCFKEEVNLTYRVANRSCAHIPKGTPFSIKITDLINNTSETRDYQTDTIFYSNTTLYFSKIIPLSMTDETSYAFELTFDKDPDQTNNTGSYSFTPVKTISNTYYQDFTTLKEDTLIQTNGFAAGLKEHQDEWYLATTGVFQDGAVNNLCPEAEETIGGYSDNNFLMCVDLDKMSSPELSFDLTQFRNEREIDFPELFDNTAVFNLVIKGENYEEVDNIYGLTNGSEEFFKYDLPEKFKGSIQMNFFNLTGRLTNPNYLDYDVTFMDNLYIGDESVGNKNIQEDDVLSVSPNPSQGIFLLGHNLDPVEIRVNDLSGRRVYTETTSFGNLNLSGFKSGTYLMTVLYKTGERRTARLIKNEN